MSTARISALNEVEEEIEARKLRLKMLKEEHAKRNGVAHPDKAPLGRSELNASFPDDRPAEQRVSFGEKRQAREEKRAPVPSTGKATPVEQKVLDAAAALYKPGDPAWPTELANHSGMNRTQISVAICNLNKKGLWPYAPCGPGKRKSATAGDKPAPSRVTTRPTPEPSEPPTLKPSELTPKATRPEPYPGYVPNTDPKSDPELLVVQRILAQLDRLPSWHARRRVLAYLDSREIEMEPLEP